jgi:hypothetical protein
MAEIISKSLTMVLLELVSMPRNYENIGIRTKLLNPKRYDPENTVNV